MTVDLPLLLYDIPSRTQVRVEPDTIAALAEYGTIIGMKACNPDLAHFNRVIDLVDGRIGVMSGEDVLFPAHAALGAGGGVLASATLIPHYWIEIANLIQDGELAEALVRHRRLLPLFDALFAETNPGPLKAALRLIGLEIGEVLLPLKPPAPVTVAKLETALAALRAARILSGIAQAA